MTRKRLWFAVGALLVIVFLAWRWTGRAPTEADDQKHPPGTSGDVVAAVARAERHTAFVQVSLKEGHKVGSYEYMRRVRRQLSRQLPQLNLGLGSIVEFSQAELQKTEADIADTDARYQYRLTQIVLAYTTAAPK
jgi:hypothetical protein